MIPVTINFGSINASAAKRRPVLKAYRAKRRQWVNWLDEDRNHATWIAISAIVWSNVSFRTLAQLALSDTASALGNTLTC
jgi:hypothetical protein